MNRAKNRKLIFKELKNVRADQDFLNLLRVNLIQYIKLNPPIPRLPQPKYRFLGNRIAVASLIAGLLIIFGGAGGVVAAQQSLPGDPLYPVKLLSEKASLVLVLTPEKKTEKRLEFAQNRIAEIEEVTSQLSGVEASARARDLEPALQNFKSQLEQISNQAKDLRGGGRFDKAFETSAKLEAAIPFYQGRLKQIQEIDGNEFRQKIDDTLLTSEDLRKEVEKETEEISDEEESRAKGEGFEKSTKEKLDAIESKIEETQRAIERKAKESDTHAIKSAEQKLNEAKEFLNNSRADFKNKKYEDAFNKAQKVMRAALEAQVLIQVKNRDKIQKRQGRGKNKIDVTSTPENIILPDSNHIDDQKRGDKFEERGENNQEEKSKNNE